jgi:hypothetical protein
MARVRRRGEARRMEAMNGNSAAEPAITGVPAFYVEVDGTWRDPQDGATTWRSAAFRVSAPGAAAAETVAEQLFAALARGERCQTVVACSSHASLGE